MTIRNKCRQTGCYRSGLTGIVLAIVANVAISSEAATHTLLIGINKYRDPNFATLRGPENDVSNFETMLTREYTVPQENITVLRGQKATHCAVTGALKDLAGNAGTEDVVLIHFSGHGARVIDTNGDEDEDTPGDTVDEALVLYDSTHTGDAVLIDDRFGELLNQIQCKYLTVILDCCHSGSGTRVLSPPVRLRAKSPHWNLPEMNVRYVQIKQNIGVKNVRGVQPRQENGAVTADIAIPSEGQSRVVLSACNASEKAIEIHHHDVKFGFYSGSLTHFLVEGLRGPADRDSNGEVSYREAHRYAKNRVAETLQSRFTNTPMSQTPVIEARRADLDLPFASLGELNSQRAKTKPSADGMVTLDLGAVHGLRTGHVLKMDHELQNIGTTIRVSRVGIHSSSCQIIVGNTIPEGASFVLHRSQELPVETLAFNIRPERITDAVACSLASSLNSEMAAIPLVRLYVDAECNAQLKVSASPLTEGQTDVKMACLYRDGSIVSKTIRVSDPPFRSEREILLREGRQLLLNTNRPKNNQHLEP